MTWQKLKGITYTNLFLALSLFTVALSSIYIGRKEAFFNAVNGDAVVFNNLFSDSFKVGDIYVLSEHTFIIKYPIFLLENIIGFDISTHVFFSALTLLAMNLGICGLMFYFSNKNKLLTSILALALANITLFYMVQNYFWGYSSLAIRNIEIPLVFFAIVALFRQKKVTSFKSLSLVGLLALVCVSDKIILTLVAGALFLYFLAELAVQKNLGNIKHVFTTDKTAYITILLGIVIAAVIEVILKLTDILLLTSTIPALTTESVVSLVNAIPKFISSLINLFGANFFNRTILEIVPNLINLVIALICVYVTFVLAKHYFDIKNKAIKFILMMVLTNIALYFLIQGAAIDRYLAILPLAMLIFVAYRYRHWQPQTPRPAHVKLLCIVSVLVVFAMFVIYSKNQHSVMTSTNYNNIASPLTQTRDLSTVLYNNNVGMVVGNYWLIHPAKFWYDQKFNGDLDIVSVQPLSEEKVRLVPFLSRKSWLTNPTDTSRNSAYAIRDFDYGPDVDIDKAAKSTFGDYTKKIYYPDGAIHLYIYDYDIRGKVILE